MFHKVVCFISAMVALAATACGSGDTGGEGGQAAKAGTLAYCAGSYTGKGQVSEVKATLKGNEISFSIVGDFDGTGTVSEAGAITGTGNDGASFSGTFDLTACTAAGTASHKDTTLMVTVTDDWTITHD